MALDRSIGLVLGTAASRHRRILGTLTMMSTRHVVAAGLAVSLLFAGQTRSQSQAPAFDLVIRGGRVIDGTGNPWILADIGIKADVITAVAPQLDTSGARVIDRKSVV